MQKITLRHKIRNVRLTSLSDVPSFMFYVSGKMHARLFSASLKGLEASPVEIEVNAMGGSLSSLQIVGLPDQAVSESKERITAAIKNSGFKPPHQFPFKTTINLAPADIKKEGPAFDLPIALAFLAATGQIPRPATSALFIGELGLTGQIRKVKGVLSTAILAKKLSKDLYLPRRNLREASLVSRTNFYPATSLPAIIHHLTKERLIEPCRENIAAKATDESEKKFLIDSIKGQETAKRALTIAAAGGHNLLFVGPPGSGKTVLAKSMTELLPPLTKEEIIDVTKVYSAVGQLFQNKTVAKRPFRSPHHSASAAAVIGGGNKLRPGEITMAHHGVLFLDELPEFQRPVLESLREPLEEGRITIARAKETICYPAKFTMVAAMNPCACGYLTDEERPCRCSMGDIKRYQRKISGPFLDRFDLIQELPRLTSEKIIGKKEKADEGAGISSSIKKARSLQKRRLKTASYSLNSEVPYQELDTYIPLAVADRQFLASSVDKLNLSMRAYHRILRVARTIADLAEEEKVTKNHILEALQYRERQEI